MKTLLEGLLPKVTVINEPRHIACGASDYILRYRRTAFHLGFVEAKDIGDGDLDGNGIHKEQFNLNSSVGIFFDGPKVHNAYPGMILATLYVLRKRHAYGPRHFSFVPRKSGLEFMLITSL